jgi:hypothetical protein
MRFLLLAAALVATLPLTARAETVCRTVKGNGACVTYNVPGSGTGPTLRITCGGTTWDCATITIP